MTSEKRVTKNKEKLDNLCIEYCKLEEEKRQYYSKNYWEDDLSSHTIQTLFLMQIGIDQLVRKIVKSVDWFIRNDADHDNECATLVYNYYAPMLHRGLDCLTV